MKDNVSGAVSSSSAEAPPWSRYRRILGLALPISAAMISQSILNLVDTAMVGSLGDAALGAVGMGGFVLFMCQSLILGVSVGVQSMAARRKGEGKFSETAHILNSGLLVIGLAGPLLSVAMILLAPWFYPWLNDDPAVLALAVPYFQIRMAAATFTGMNYSFRGYWNAVDMSRVYMTTLLVMHSTNIFLNWVLIFGNLGAPTLGVSGAALASAVSVVVGTGLYTALGVRHARQHGFLKKLAPPGENRTLARLTLPASFQQFAIMASMTALFWIVGQIGTSELAATAVLINISTFAVLPAMGLAFGATTLVSQALGGGSVEEAERWAKDCVRIGVLVLGILATPMWLTPELILGVFIHDDATLALARLPMQIIGVTVVVEGVKRVYMQSLMGAGDNRRVMRVTVGTQWLLFVPLAYLVGPVLGLGLLGVWIAQEAHRLLQGGIFWLFWKQRHWATIRI